MSTAFVLTVIAATLGGQPVGTPEVKSINYSQNTGSLRIGVVGLVHGHVEGLLWQDAQRDDITIVGIVEPDDAVFARLAEKYKLTPDLRCKDIPELVAKHKPEAVSVMTDIASHAEVARQCAPLGVHMLFEKPLAFTAADARAIAEVCAANGVLALTNYETSWYTSVRECKLRLEAGTDGAPRKLIFRHGHRGPREIGCSPEFVSWLTDPARNGGGALIDFGCYGAILSTWLMNGERPINVTASATTLKPDVYPHVDDDATINITYKHTTATVQASWAWTHDNKEMDVYCEKGSLHAGRGGDITLRSPDKAKVTIKPQPLPAHLKDEWTYLTLAVRGKCPIDPLSGIEYNIIAVEILDAARTQVQRK
jgi:predicted dehydrogenase